MNLFSRLPVKDKSVKVTCKWVGPYRVVRIVNPNIVEIVTLDLDVPLDHAPPSGDVPPDEDEDAPHDDANEEEELPDVVLTEGPPLEASSPCPEVLETLPLL